jgi:hypothetical protein
LPVASVSFAFELVNRDEPQRSRIDAVAQPTRFARAVRKDMAQVAIRRARANLGSEHAVADVAIFDDGFGLDRLRETRPTTAAVELIHGSKQRLARNHVYVKTRFLVVPIGVLERMFRPVTLCHFKLLRRKAGDRFWTFLTVRHLALPNRVGCGRAELVAGT